MRFILFFHPSTVRYNYRVEAPLFLLCSKSKNKLSLRLFPRTATLWKYLPRGCSPDSIYLCFLKSKFKLYSSFLSSLYSLPTTSSIHVTHLIHHYKFNCNILPCVALETCIGRFLKNLKSFYYLLLFIYSLFAEHIYFYFSPHPTPLTFSCI